jgi:hypothetical protein
MAGKPPEYVRPEGEVAVGTSDVTPGDPPVRLRGRVTEASAAKSERIMLRFAQAP